MIKLGDLIEWRGVTYLCSRAGITILYLQSLTDTSYPPNVMDKGLVNVYKKRGELRIISKA
jgi:hypothetical protein